MKVKDQKPEREIDKLVTAQAEDEKFWTDLENVKRRGKLGNSEKFFKALSKVPNIQPEPKDAIE